MRIIDTVTDETQDIENLDGAILFDYKNDLVKIVIGGSEIVLQSDLSEQKRKEDEKYYTLSSLGVDADNVSCIIQYAVSEKYMDRVNLLYIGKTVIYYIGNTSMTDE